jgi:hypothetical protein
MEVFNLILSGKALDNFLAMNNEQRKEWIKTSTNQSNEKVIDQFLAMPFKENSGCVSCGELNNKIENPVKDGNISEGVHTAVVESEQPNLDGANGTGNRNKRPKNAKRA